MQCHSRTVGKVSKVYSPILEGTLPLIPKKDYRNNTYDNRDTGIEKTRITASMTRLQRDVGS